MRFLIGALVCICLIGPAGAQNKPLNGTETFLVQPNSPAAFNPAAAANQPTTTGAVAALAYQLTTQAGTTYTLQLADCTKEIVFTNASAVTVTIPATLPVGCTISLLQAGASKVSVNGTAVAAATLQSAHSYTGTFGQWSIIGVNIESNTNGSSAIAVLIGDGS